MKDEEKNMIQLIYAEQKADVIATIKSFCERTKMNYNDKVDNYDFNIVVECYKKGNIEAIDKELRANKVGNIRLCNFGKTDTCRTASIWYAPSRGYHDFALRIEKPTYDNYCRVAVNKFLFERQHAKLSHETNKADEYRISFASLHDVLTFFEQIFNNYRAYVQSTAKEAVQSTAMKEA